MTDKANQESTPSGQSGETNDEVGFGAAFAERANDPQRDEATETHEDDEQSSSTEEPAAAGSTEAPQAAAEEAGSGTEAEAFDPYAGMTPEQKSHWQRLQASETSNRGRVSALNRKLREGSRAPAPTTIEQAQTEDDASEGASASDLDKRLQAAQEEYGEVVGPLVEALAEVRAEMASMKGTVSQVDELVNEQELADAYEALRIVHPDFAEFSPENTSFIAWLGDQPEQVGALANSFDPREVSLALTLFKTERSAAIALQTGEGGETGQQAGTATDTKRARQIEGSRAVLTRGAPAAAGTPNDFSSAFRARAAASR